MHEGRVMISMPCGRCSQHGCTLPLLRVKLDRGSRFECDVADESRQEGWSIEAAPRPHLETRLLLWASYWAVSYLLNVLFHGAKLNTCRVYADAVQQIKAWHGKGIAVWIYSSGSVEAQKLLFKYSEAGNLLEVCIIRGEEGKVKELHGGITKEGVGFVLDVMSWQNIAGHFDTAVGGKRDPASYRTIAEQIGVDASNILFVTDVIEGTIHCCVIAY